MKYITLIIGLLVVGCGQSDTERLEAENERLKAELADRKKLKNDLGAENKRLNADLEAKDKKFKADLEAKDKKFKADLESKDKKLKEIKPKAHVFIFWLEMLPLPDFEK